MMSGAPGRHPDQPPQRQDGPPGPPRTHSAPPAQPTGKMQHPMPGYPPAQMIRPPQGYFPPYPYPMMQQYAGPYGANHVMMHRPPMPQQMAPQQHAPQQQAVPKPAAVASSSPAPAPARRRIIAIKNDDGSEVKVEKAKPTPEAAAATAAAAKAKAAAVAAAAAAAATPTAAPGTPGTQRSRAIPILSPPADSAKTPFFKKSNGNTGSTPSKATAAPPSTSAPAKSTSKPAAAATKTTPAPTTTPVPAAAAAPRPVQPAAATTTTPSTPSFAAAAAAPAPTISAAAIEDLPVTYGLNQWSPWNRGGDRVYKRSFFSEFGRVISKPPADLNSEEINKYFTATQGGRNMGGRGRNSNGGRGGGGGGAVSNLGFDIGGSGSRGNHRNGPRRSGSSGQPRVITLPRAEDAKPLKKSEDAWSARSVSKKDGEGEDPLATSLLEVRSFVNKITPQTFESLGGKLLKITIEIQNYDQTEMKADTTLEPRMLDVVHVIFSTALDQPHFSEVYAQLCQRVASELHKASGGRVPEKQDFRKILLSKCQKEFEKDRSAEDAAKARDQAKADATAATPDAAAADKEKDAAAQAKTKEEEEEEVYQRAKAKRHMLGNIQFIGELFKQKMIPLSVIHACLSHLVSDVMKTEEATFECLCTMLETAGASLEIDSKSKELLDGYMKKLQEVANKRKGLSSRVKFMILDVLELRERKWQARRKKAGPKKINEIHEEIKQAELASKELLAQSEAEKRRNPRGSSRGRGNDRRMGGARTQNSGNDWMMQSKPRERVDHNKFGAKRSTDFTSLGPSAGRLGGASRFGRGGASAGAKKSVSGRGSSGEDARKIKNNFAALLVDDSEPSNDSAASEAGAGAASDVDDGIDLTEAEMKKVRGTVLEYLSLRDVSEVEETLKELEAQSAGRVYFVWAILAKFVEEGHKKDTRETLVALTRNMLKKGSISPAAFEKGLLKYINENFEDDMVDVPNAVALVAEQIGLGIIDAGLELTLLTEESIMRLNQDMSGDKALKLVLDVLAAVHKHKDEATMLSVFNKLPMPLADWLSDEKKTDATLVDDLLDRKNLKMLIGKNPGSAGDGAKSAAWEHEISTLLKKDGTVESVSAWIDTAIPDAVGNADLARAITRAVVTFVVGRTTIVADEDKNKEPTESAEELEDALATKWLKLVKTYAVGAELHVICSVQALADEWTFPPGLVDRWFGHVNDVIDDEFFTQWKEDDGISKSELYPGKGNTVMQAKEFMNTLGEDEDDEDS